MKNFNTAITEAKLDYISDIEWSYEFKNQFICVNFYKDENGTNIIEQFCQNVNGQWFDVIPTDKQVKTMFKRLDDTPYREVEIEHFTEDSNYQNDPYYGFYGLDA
jgi:hypothetical protein